MVDTPDELQLASAFHRTRSPVRYIRAPGPTPYGSATKRSASNPDAQITPSHTRTRQIQLTPTPAPPTANRRPAHSVRVLAIGRPIRRGTRATGKVRGGRPRWWSRVGPYRLVRSSVSVRIDSAAERGGQRLASDQHAQARSASGSCPTRSCHSAASPCMTVTPCRAIRSSTEEGLRDRLLWVRGRLRHRLQRVGTAPARRVSNATVVTASRRSSGPERDFPPHGLQEVEQRRMRHDHTLGGGRSTRTCRSRTRRRRPAAALHGRCRTGSVSGIGQQRLCVRGSPAPTAAGEPPAGTRASVGRSGEQQGGPASSSTYSMRPAGGPVQGRYAAPALRLPP